MRQLTLAVKLAAASASVFVLFPSAETQAFTLKEIAEVCGGISGATVDGGKGTYTTGSGLDVDISADRTVTISRSGELLLKIERFTFQEYSKCLSDLFQAQAQPPQPRLCRDRSHGVERYGREFDDYRESGWRGGGYDPDRWCNDVIAILRGQHPEGEFAVVSKGERSESKCSAFNCPQYNYHCTVRVKTDPIYNERVSAACR